MPHALKVLTWHVNGILNKIKRGAVLRHTHRLNPDIALLQETHLLRHNTPFLARMGYGATFYSGFTRGASGVMILIRSCIQFVCDKVWHDQLCRYIGVTGKIQCVPISGLCV